MFHASAIVIKLETQYILTSYMHSYPSSSSSSPKELWCFGCNCMRGVCLHDACPVHCDMCIRIRELAPKSGMSPSS
jgi:hypothetical protein